MLIKISWISKNSPALKLKVDSYFELLQRDFLLQEAPHHADHCVELWSCVLAIRDHFDEGQRRQLILRDDWPVWGKTEWRAKTEIANIIK